MLKYPGRHGLRRGAQGRRLGRIARPRRAGEARARGAGAVRAPARRRSSPASASGSLYKALNVAFKGWKDTPEKVSARRSRRRLDLGGDLARAARRRLHHRPAHRVDHVRGRRARLPGADPRDQVLRRRAGGAARAGHDAHRGHGPEPDPRRLRPLHRRRRGRGRRHHQPAAIAADHLARPARRAARLPGRRRGTAAARCRAPTAISR